MADHPNSVDIITGKEAFTVGISSCLEDPPALKPRKGMEKGSQEVGRGKGYTLESKLLWRVDKMKSHPSPFPGAEEKSRLKHRVGGKNQPGAL